MHFILSDELFRYIYKVFIFIYYMFEALKTNICMFYNVPQHCKNLKLNSTFFIHIPFTSSLISLVYLVFFIVLNIEKLVVLYFLFYLQLINLLLSSLARQTREQSGGDCT